MLLDGMLLGPNIARNSALRENVFMMVICIELRIPLFLVGKPGSSKSLAKSIVSSSMQGKASQHPLLRHFKQVLITVHVYKVIVHVILCCLPPTGSYVLLPVQSALYS